MYFVGSKSDLYLILSDGALNVIACKSCMPIGPVMLGIVKVVSYHNPPSNFQCPRSIAIAAQNTNLLGK